MQSFYIHGQICTVLMFAVSASRLWNALPCELKIATSLISFKRLLNIHLFRMACEQSTVNLNVEQFMGQKRVSI